MNEFIDGFEANKGNFNSNFPSWKYSSQAFLFKEESCTKIQDEEDWDDFNNDKRWINLPHQISFQKSTRIINIHITPLKKDNSNLNEVYNQIKLLEEINKIPLKENETHRIILGDFNYDTFKNNLECKSLFNEITKNWNRLTEYSPTTPTGFNYDIIYSYSKKEIFAYKSDVYRFPKWEGFNIFNPDGELSDHYPVFVFLNPVQPSEFQITEKEKQYYEKYFNSLKESNSELVLNRKLCDYHIKNKWDSKYISSLLKLCDIGPKRYLTKREFFYFYYFISKCSKTNEYIQLPDSIPDTDIVVITEILPTNENLAQKIGPNLENESSKENSNVQEIVSESSKQLESNFTDNKETNSEIERIKIENENLKNENENLKKELESLKKLNLNKSSKLQDEENSSPRVENVDQKEILNTETTNTPSTSTISISPETK